MRGRLVMVASLVAGHGLEGTWASVVVAHGLSSSKACRIFPDQESSPGLQHWQVGS